ncbi:MAG: sulfite exporter TauE/SafE family protein [Pseudomonadota bacterium]
MPDILAQAFQTEGLIWLVLAVAVAGLVRGFSGFGSAMIIMPAAAAVLSPVEAVIFLSMVELLGPLPNLRAALRDGAPREVGLLVLGAVLALPPGLWWLTRVDPTVFGWAVSLIVLGLLALLMTGWRYRGKLTRPLTVGTGALGGFMTGFSGIPGPPVIMLYMASTLPIKVIRANFLLYLLGIDLILIPMLLAAGLMAWDIVVLGLLVGLVNVSANWLGAKLFDPKAEQVFRAVAYMIIAASALLGLPIWRG